MNSIPIWSSSSSRGTRGTIGGGVASALLFAEGNGKLPRLPQHLERWASLWREMSIEHGFDWWDAVKSVDGLFEGRPEDQKTWRRVAQPCGASCSSRRIESMAPRPERLTNHPPSDVNWSDHQRLHREKCPISSHHAHPSPHARVKSSLQSQNTWDTRWWEPRALLIVKFWIYFEPVSGTKVR